MKFQAIIVAAPFSFSLGILTSAFAIILGTIDPWRKLHQLLVFANLLTICLCFCSVQGVCLGIFSISVCTCGYIPSYILFYGELSKVPSGHLMSTCPFFFLEEWYCFDCGSIWKKVLWRKWVASWTRQSQADSLSRKTHGFWRFR